jgi:glucose/mannose-6-phosphate isomerase
MILDQDKLYAKYDSIDIGYATERMPEQFRMTWEATRDLKLPASYKKCTNVVLMGMGGSAIGPHMIRSIFYKDLKVPFEIFNRYELPASATRNTLVLISSFSGTTEEIVAAMKEGKRRKLKMAIVSTGGDLIRYAKRYKIPFYQFDPGDWKETPRLGVGFTITAHMAFMEKAGLLKVRKSHIDKMIKAMVEVIDSCAVSVKTEENPAKVTAMAIVKKPILIVAAEHLEGNAHVMQNHINESGKQMARYMILPELNHHLLEGLTYPTNLFAKYAVLMLRSDLYHKRTQARFDITANLFEKMGAEVIDYNCAGKTAVEEGGEVLQFGAFLSYYLAMANKVDPKAIPYVDKFKKELKKVK